ncbi:putative mycofactocin binding protein MftB [Mycobacterium sp. MAA66]
MSAPAAARTEPTGGELPAPPAVAELPAPPASAFDPDRGWQLHPQVAVRPEPFGALLYHFGTRKLSFLKNRTIVEVVNSLADHPDVRSACRAAGIDDDQQAPYLHAFGVLVGSKMLIPTVPNSPEGSTAP